MHELDFYFIYSLLFDLHVRIRFIILVLNVMFNFIASDLESSCF